MSSTNTTTNKDADYSEDSLVEEFAMLYSGKGGGEENKDEDFGLRRNSRASVDFFQRETSKIASFTDEGQEVLLTSSQVKRGGKQGKRKPKRNSFIGLDGKIQDKYIAKRASLNKPDKSLEDVVPLLVDLKDADTMTRVDGRVLSQLFISGYAKLGSKVDLLNRINVYPIADGDTGANMRVCLKLPARNLILDPSNSPVRVASNMAADVLLNGQGNSGTILSHFFVSLAEEIGDIKSNSDSDSLSIDEFAMCLAKTGKKMADAVANPQEGTIVSVSRDSCDQLWKGNSSYSTLKELLQTWNDIAQSELQKTPDQLIVDGVKVLEKAGVVDSGAQGFVFMVEGMLLASEGELPEAFDPHLFKTSVKSAAGDYVEDLAAINDYNTCDTKYQYCTEAVILLKDEFTKKDVMDMIDTDCKDIGDSVACVGAPAKEGGNMCKIHIHSNNPQEFFDKLLPYSRSPTYKKEKVEDMKIMRALEHGDLKSLDLGQAKFTILGGKHTLPSPEKDSEDMFGFPMFAVPEDTGEPIDVRYATDTDTLVALNQQRNKSTAIKYSSATSSPMQMKIELLAALAKGKPVLVFLFSTSKKFSAMGRNALKAIDMLDSEQKKLVTLFVHGSVVEDVLLIEAIKCAKEGMDIDETHAILEDIADRTSQSIMFMSSQARKKMKALRPAFFPDEIVDGTIKVSGTPGCVRKDGCPVEARIVLGLAEIAMTDSASDAFEVAVKHIKDGLQEGQKIGNVMIPCVGRPDIGNQFLKMIEDAGIEIVGTPRVFNEGIGAVLFGDWGQVNLRYNIIE